jgi:drug/metabolite transporter (DMT)-like permease
METKVLKPASPLLVIIAFATVYIVWGSTYFFIRVSEQGGFPPFLLGAVRFTLAGLLMMVWCVIKREKLFIWKNVLNASISGILLLTIATGIVIWSEQSLPSAMVAIMVSSSPIWFVLIDKPNWGLNFKSKPTIIGLVIGFIGVILLFSEEIENIFKGSVKSQLPWMLLLVFGTIAWSCGSLYSKYKLTSGSAQVNTAWQMLAAGIAFIPGVFLRCEYNSTVFQNINLNGWLAVGYLVLFGSLAAFSAYVWLLQVRPATQVSTYAYVNPVIAVFIGILFAAESVSFWQITGLVTILSSVLLINLANYRKEKHVKKIADEPLVQVID